MKNIQFISRAKDFKAGGFNVPIRCVKLRGKKSILPVYQLKGRAIS